MSACYLDILQDNVGDKGSIFENINKDFAEIIWPHLVCLADIL